MSLFLKFPLTSQNIVLKKIKEADMEKTTGCHLLLTLIFLALISVEEIQPCVKPEHASEMPYSAPDFSMRPIVMAVTMSAPFITPWREM